MANIHTPSDWVKVVPSIPPLLRDDATTVNGASADTAGYSKALVIIHVGANDVASTFELEDSADDSSFADVDVPSAAWSVVTTSDDETNETYLIDLDLTGGRVRRYLRVQHDPGNGTLGTNAGACILLFGGESKNPAQDNDVLSNLS